MDVGAPSNFERMMWLCGGDADALRGELQGSRIDAMIRRTIDGLYRNYGYLSDPHSAAWLSRPVAGRGLLSTAHPAKFGESTTAHRDRAKVPPPRLVRSVPRFPGLVDGGGSWALEYVAGA